MAPKKKITNKDMDAMEEKLMARSDHKIGGSYLIPILQWIVIHIILKGNYKYIFPGFIAFVAIFFSLFTAALVFFGGFMMWMATFTRRPRPKEIPLAPPGIDVLLGRPIQVSEYVAEKPCNNNVTITVYKDSYVLAYRQSDHHFPSGQTRIVVAQSPNLTSWTTTWMYANGCDLRETLLFEMKGELFLYFFSLKPDHGQFHPLHVYVTKTTDLAVWPEPKEVCRQGEVPWEIKLREEKGQTVAYKSSYLGDHYGEGDIWVLFEKSLDGIKWTSVGESSVVYSGGISEVSFEFTTSGDLVAIGRNEDGDHTGFGSQLFFARSSDLGNWSCLATSIPYRFDSPRLLPGLGGEIILCARYHTEPYQFVPTSWSFQKQKNFNLITYSFFSKTAAIFRIAPQKEWGTGEGAVQLIRCFEHTAGDTGFFAVTREIGSQSENGFVVANYSTVNIHSHAPWIIGQMNESHIFVSRIRFWKKD